MNGYTKPSPEPIVLDMTDFPSAAECARQERGYIPAAGFALIPPAGEERGATWLWLPLTLLLAAGAGAYRLLTRGSTPLSRK